MAGTRFTPVFAGVRWTPWTFVAAFPPVLYFLICCHLWIHNASHGNFPRWANRIVGEVLGFIVFVRFASWQIVHVRHHDFSDDGVRDVGGFVRRGGSEQDASRTN